MFQNDATHFDRTLSWDGVRKLEYTLYIIQERIWMVTVLYCIYDRSTSIIICV